MRTGEPHTFGEMLRAVEQALAPTRSDEQRQVVLLTDGEIGFEAEVIGTVVRDLPAASRVHVVGVGSAPNRALTRGLSRAGRGLELLIPLADDPSGAAARLVDVFHADQPRARGGQRIAVARERRDERTEVERTGGRRREAAAIAGLLRRRRACMFPPNGASRRSPQGATALGRPGGGHRGAVRPTAAAVADDVDDGGYEKWRFIAASTAPGYSGRPRLPL